MCTTIIISKDFKEPVDINKKTFPDECMYLKDMTVELSEELESMIQIVFHNTKDCSKDWENRLAY